MSHPARSNEADELVTTEGAATLLKCSMPTIRRLIARGKLSPVRIGRLLRFRRSDVLTAIG